MNKQVVKAFDELGSFLRTWNEELEILSKKAEAHNLWFKSREIENALKAWGNLLEESKIEKWLNNYQKGTIAPINIGLILAGNIPMVGFHDICCVLLSGHKASIKLSSQDGVLIPFLLDKLIGYEPSLKEKIAFPERMNEIDAIIATGSNNSAKHFEYYFGKMPHIIRKNRNSIAVLNGTESTTELELLGNDVFDYYGQGCRNVSKIYVPTNYDLTKLLDVFEKFAYIADHHKYFNNYSYYKSIYLVNREDHLDNGFLILKESDKLQAPLSVLYYERYSEPIILEKKLQESENEIQCAVSKEKLKISNQTVGFGETQTPDWADYADNVDTMKFLTEL